jgi:hypothetical protein
MKCKPRFCHTSFGHLGWAGLGMDIRDLKFEGGSFDVAIDKGPSLRLGRFAAVVTGQQVQWTP